jgi:hypothetical protein
VYTKNMPTETALTIIACPTAAAPSFYRAEIDGRCVAFAEQAATGWQVRLHGAMDGMPAASESAAVEALGMVALAAALT